jgi:hypothetical protein
VLLAAGALAGILLSPPSPEATREAVRRILAQAEYQTEMPVPEWRRVRETRDPPATPPPRERVGDRVPEETPATPPPTRVSRDDRSDADRGGESGLGRAVFWTLLAVAGVLAVAWVVRSRRRVERDVVPASPAVAGAAADPAVVARPLTAAERLAKDGRFGEAVHELLLQTLAALLARSELPIARSLTSREILARVRLPGEARECLEALVLAAEACHFGGRPASADDYARSTDHFRRFASAYGRAAA